MDDELGTLFLIEWGQKPSGIILNSEKTIKYLYYHTINFKHYSIGAYNEIKNWEFKETEWKVLKKGRKDWRNQEKFY